MNKYQQSIDDYLQDELSDKEKVSFQQQLDKEEELSSLFKEQQLLADGIRLSILRNRLSHLQVISSAENSIEKNTIEQTFRHQRNLEVMERLKGKELELEKKATKSIFSIRKWAVAASLISAIGIGFIWLSQQYSPIRVIQEGYYAINLEEGRNEMNRTSELNDVITAYISADYRKAMMLLNEIPMNSVESDLIRGHTQLHLHQADEAIESFSKVLQSNDLRFYENAHWHLSLAYLLKGDESNARKIIESFRNSTTPKFKNMSKDILEKLDSPFWDIFN